MAKRVEKLILSNPERVRLTLSRLLRQAYDEGVDVDSGRYRLYLDYGKQLLAGFKLESDMRVQDDVAEIKRVLKSKGLL